MKCFVLIFISLITLFIITSCGLIHTTKIDKEIAKFAKEYSGLYVFEPKFRDEVEEIQQKRYELFVRAYNKALRSKGIKSTKTMYGSPLWEQLEAISRDVDRELDETYPQILSNGCKYSDHSYYLYSLYSEKKGYKKIFQPYLDKIKEYMGEEVFEKLSKDLAVTSYYVDKNNEMIPIVIQAGTPAVKTTYGLYGDESRPRFTETKPVTLVGNNIFYLKNDKFVKSNDKGEGARQ